MATRDRNPLRVIAKIAIDGMGYAVDCPALEEVIRYAFDQLCWRRTTPELEALLAELRATMSEEA
jgi:hypothetical protein